MLAVGGQGGQTLALRTSGLCSWVIVRSLAKNADKWQHQLNGGDDYQLCFTMSEQSFVKFNQQFSDKIFAIGKIVTENGLRLIYNNQPIEFSITGYQHF